MDLEPMKKVLIFTLLIAFYLVTQLNFTGFGSTGKKSCDEIKITVKKCSRLLEQHTAKVKQIETNYKTKSVLDYSVNLTAENSTFIENYQLVKRDSERVAVEGERSPASTCPSDESTSLKSCMDEVNQIYKSLVPN